jgi:RNA polymerase sigma-70 factor (ECF subfamily)
LPPEHDPSSDAALLARLAEDDASALDALLARYWLPLTAYLTRVTGSHATAEDVAQDTFCRIWERRAAWRESGSVRGLLFRLARNIAISEHRRRRALDRATDHLGALSRRDVAAFDAVGDDELRRALERAIAALPERRREVFLLRAVHDLSYKEIAAVMGTSPQTVANQLSHALSTLRTTLAHLLD